jgi:hypothetical protein
LQIALRRGVTIASSDKDFILDLYRSLSGMLASEQIEQQDENSEHKEYMDQRARNVQEKTC